MLFNRIKGTSIYLFCDSIASLIGARNPHVHRVLSGFSGSVRLALEPLMTINRGALKGVSGKQQFVLTFCMWVKRD